MSQDRSIDKQITDWHNLNVDDAVKRLYSDRHHSLSSLEALERLKRLGRNRLPPLRKLSAFCDFFSSFTTL